MEQLKNSQSAFNGAIDINGEELTFAKLDLNLKTKPSEAPHLKIQTPRGLVITIPSGIDKDTVETVLNSLWKLQC